MTLDTASALVTEVYGHRFPSYVLGLLREPEHLPPVMYVYDAPDGYTRGHCTYAALDFSDLTYGTLRLAESLDRQILAAIDFHETERARWAA